MQDLALPSEADFKVLYEDSTFIDHVGPLRIGENEAGAFLKLAVEKQHTNPNGGVHGGVLLTLLDLVQGLAVQAQLRRAGLSPSGHPTTIQLSCSFVAGARLGETLVGRGMVERSSKTVSFATGQILCGGRLVASATSVFRNPPPSGA